MDVIAGYKESWVPKNWCFWNVMLEKTLGSPLDCKEIKPVNPKEISPEYSSEGLMLKLKRQSFGHLNGRTDSFEKTLLLGKIEGRRRGRQRMRWLDASPTQWTWVWASSRRWWRTGKPDVLKSTGSQKVRHDWATELNWTDLKDTRKRQGIEIIRYLLYCYCTVVQLLYCWGVQEI